MVPSPSPAFPAKGQPSKSVSLSEAMEPAAVVRSSLLSGIPSLRCGLSTRNGGVSREPYGMNTSYSVGDAGEHVEENRKRFLAALGIPPDQVASPRQRHTATIRKISAAGAYEDCDALMTDTPNVFLSVTVADCVPIFLYDREQKIVACVHAGWRGTQQQILLNTIRTMKQEFGSLPETTLAFIGPSAAACCYEIGEDVAKQFGSEVLSSRGGKTYLDLKQANKMQLHLGGIPDVNIEVHEHCTICNLNIYHSYRRDRDRSGRMMGVIGMTQ
ncbi:MAG TPA: peptidoglycan editing factor PgeF [Bacteroidota bacterium]